MAWSVDSLIDDLRKLGLGPGDTVLVHSSLRAIGRVSGGAAGVVAAIRQVLGDEGTLVVPTFNEENSKTSRAHLERIEGLTEQQAQAFREGMPAFDKSSTPSSTGRISEQVRHLPDAERSDHPVVSFAAAGAKAKSVTADHARDCYHGEESPLGRLYAEGASVLLVGVGYDKCAAFHLAEYHMEDAPRGTYWFVIDDGAGPDWQSVESIILDDGDFAELGADFEKETGLAKPGRLGSAQARLLPMAPAVDFAVSWLSVHRRAR